MKYEVRIPKDGMKVNVEVLEPGTHNCEETILHVCNTFGTVSSVKSKDDEQPLHQDGHININPE